MPHRKGRREFRGGGDSRNCCLKIGAVTCVASTLGDTCHRGDAVLGVGVGGQAWENQVSVGFPFNSWQLLPVCNYHCAQTLCEPMDCSPPGSSVYGILQAGILEWVAVSSKGNLPDPGIELSSALAGRFFHWRHLEKLVITISRKK